MQSAGKIKTTKPGEARGILPNRKFGMDTATSGSVQYYAPQILSATDYYAFGAPLPGRYEAVRDTGYRFGMNGQMKDNEIYGEGNTYTAMFWEYDSRVGRRWNVDPVIKPSQSTYSTFNNNPIFYVDVNGNDGEPTVDKENKTITYTSTIYYWDKKSSDGEYSEDHDKVEKLKSGQDPTFQNRSYRVDMSQDIDGSDMWTISYVTEWVPITASNPNVYERVVSTKIKQNPTHNYLTFKDNVAGGFIDRTNEIRINATDYNKHNAYINLSYYNNFQHEFGHSAGLPHDSKISDSKNPAYNDPDNGANNAWGGIMSYSTNRKIEMYEVKFHVMKILQIANSVESNIVRIHIQGNINKSTIIP